MVELIPHATVLQAAGTPPKKISEFVGRLATATTSVSVAVMFSVIVDLLGQVTVG